MKRLLFLMMLLAAGLMAVSCGHDEPEPNVSRVQDGNGKAFIENGVLVDANTDFSSSQLSKALSEHEWVRVSGFYYDNNHVSNVFELPGAVLFIHKNGTVEYDAKYMVDYALVRNYTIDRNIFTIIANETPWWSGSIYYDEVYTVISVDTNDDFGRIIMDRKVEYWPIDGLDNYDPNSLYQRFVWIYNDQQ